MEKKDNIFSDNEYKLMTEISENGNITQRELSHKLNLSLGSVNILIKKMIKEGLIKMNQVSKRQVLYMITPAGMIEKAKKTSSYIKVHYNAINQAKEKMKVTINKLSEDYDTVYALIEENEMNQIFKTSIDEYKNENIRFNVEIINKDKNLSSINNKNAILMYISEDENVIKTYREIKDLEIINLLKVI